MKKERFSKLRFKVHEITPGTPIALKYPALCQNSEFQSYKGKDRDLLIRYIVFLYDPGSDLVEEFEELQERKDAAAIEAGYKRKVDGDWPQFVQDVMSLKNDHARAMMLKFLQIIHSHLWREKCIVEQELDVYNAMRMEPIPEIKGKDAAEILAKRDSLMEMCEKRIRNLEILNRRFYADNDDLRAAGEEELPITPENAVEIMKISEN